MFDLQDYKKEKEEILSNDKLTEKGKNDAMAKLEKSSKASAREAIKDLRKRAVKNALALKKEQEKRAKELKETQKGIDYSRLNYEAQAVRSRIMASDSLSDVLEAWENVKGSNDVYVIKAFKDTGPGLISEKFKGEDVIGQKSSLLDDIQRTKVEIAKVEMSKNELEAVEKLYEIRNQAEEINEAFGKGQAVVTRVLNGIDFENDQVELGFEREVNIFDKLEKDYEVFNRLEDDYNKSFDIWQKSTKGLGDGFDRDFSDLSGTF